MPPRAYLVSAATNSGVAALVNDLEELSSEHRTRWKAIRQQSVAYEVREAVLEEARRRVDQALGGTGALGDRVNDVLRGQVSVEALAQELIEKVAKDRA
jgi:putative protein kinase ArgK-like GTPase of G3E family